MDTKWTHLLSFALLLCLVCRTVYSCECQNGGVCVGSNDPCICKSGFYGPICSNYADSYKIIFKSTPTDTLAVVQSIMENLEPYRINETIQISPGNIFKLMFYKKLSPVHLDEIKRIIQRDNPPFQDGEDRLSDFNECQETQGLQKCYGEICANNQGSFTCGCPEGTKMNAETGTCEKDDTDTRPVIYIWSAVVVAVFLVMIALIIFYRWKKIEKGKKIQREMEKKSQYPSYPTNMDDYDGTLRRSPMGSVFDAPIIGPGGRPMSGVYNPDGTSLYSYSSRMYSQSENDTFSRHRLSAPVLESYNNPGYEEGLPPPPPPNDDYAIGMGPQYSTSPVTYSTSPQGMGPGHQFSTSPGSGFQQFPSRGNEPGLAGIQEDSVSVYSGARVPVDGMSSNFPSDANLVREDRYEA